MKTKLLLCSKTVFDNWFSVGERDEEGKHHCFGCREKRNEFWSRSGIEKKHSPESVEESKREVVPEVLVFFPRTNVSKISGSLANSYELRLLRRKYSAGILSVLLVTLVSFVAKIVKY